MMSIQHTAAHTIGNIRIQPLSPWLVRIEERGPSGFENRPTFTVVERSSDPTPFQVTHTNGKVRLATDHYRLSLPENAESIEGIRIETTQGRLLKKITPKSIMRTYMPSPSDLPATWIMADTPRVIPPTWGALPPPKDDKHPNAGWDTTNSATDLYVFFPQAAGYDQFKRDFLKLTGPVPLPPLYTFGLWYSRYHPYSEQGALEVIDTFQEKNIPLDVFVVDTDWRVGASCGYAINTNLFPDMTRFIAAAHDRNVRTMFNDHPEPIGKHALDRKELRFRQEGLESLLAMGADAWWFDRNWHTHLHHLVPGINKEVWGMMLYRDVTQHYRPGLRPLIMSNVDGINNGHLEYPSHPAAHRFPIWWTGDTLSQWDYLERGIQNGVDCGINNLLPYVSEDLGGHIGQPDAEYYIRFMQFGALSPITRIHCTCNNSRYPWQYGEETEDIVASFFRLRYRLLPMIYTAAYQAWQDGTPIMRRCDLRWPNSHEASNNTQYLLGDDLLIAPIFKASTHSDNATQRTVWLPEGFWQDAWSGERYNGPQTMMVDASLEQIPVFIRVGGIIITTPQIYNTSEMTWSDLVADIFIPESNGATSRLLYEDDGISNAYTNGHPPETKISGRVAVPGDHGPRGRGPSQRDERAYHTIGHPSSLKQDASLPHNYGLTEVALSRSNETVTVKILPSAEHHHFTSADKTWTLRLHLPKEHQIKYVMLNDRPLNEQDIRFLQPAQAKPEDILAGTGSLPAPQSGAVAEIQLPRMASSSEQTLRMDFESIKIDLAK